MLALLLADNHCACTATYEYLDNTSAVAVSLEQHNVHVGKSQLVNISIGLDEL